jgi:hypothetical protein
MKCAWGESLGYPAQPWSASARSVIAATWAEVRAESNRGQVA